MTTIDYNLPLRYQKVFWDLMTSHKDDCAKERAELNIGFVEVPTLNENRVRVYNCNKAAVVIQRDSELVRITANSPDTLRDIESARRRLQKYASRFGVELKLRELR